MTGPEAAKPTRRYRILVLHPMKPANVSQGWATPMLAWFENLQRQGMIDATFAGPQPGESHPPMEAAVHGAVDGIVAVALTSEGYLSELARRKIPIVALDHKPLTAAVDSVAFNQLAAGETLARLIASLGHRDILYISRFMRDTKPVQGADPVIEVAASAERRNGLIRGLADTTTVIWPLFPWFSGGGGISADAKTDSRWRLAHTVQETGKWPDCIVTVDYTVAEEIHAVLVEQGLRVPQDISFATFWAYPYCDPHPATLNVSHMQGDYLQMAEAGWKLLASRLSSDATSRGGPRNVLIDLKYVDGGTLRDLRQCRGVPHSR